jgi:flagellin-like protein
MNNKGISGVIATVLLIALAIIAVSVVWVMVNGLISEKIKETESCFDIFGKASINPQYTCYNSSSKELFFSVNIEDIEIDKLIVSVSNKAGTKSYELEKELKEISGLTNYTKGSLVKAPDKNQGITYISTEFDEKPNSISISLVINGNKCEVSDKISNIESCFI